MAALVVPEVDGLDLDRRRRTHTVRTADDLFALGLVVDRVDDEEVGDEGHCGHARDAHGRWAPRTPANKRPGSSQEQSRAVRSRQEPPSTQPGRATRQNER